MSNIYRAFEAHQRLEPECQQQPYRAHYLPGAAVQRAGRPAAHAGTRPWA